MIKAKKRPDYLNALVGRPYRLGAWGPAEFDCYGLARHLQDVFWGREMPVFEAPEQAGRFALAAMIAAHPERGNWHEKPKPTDGAIVSMAKSGLGYHMGTFLALDGGVICHTLEDTGVTIEPLFILSTLGWRNLRFHTRD